MEFQMIPEDWRVFLDPKRLKAYGNYYIIEKRIMLIGFGEEK